MRVLIVHNHYRSAQPSGENVVVEDESALLAEHGCVVERLELSSDEIAGWPVWKKATLPLRVVWSADGYRRTAAAIARFQPDVVHFHNTFPLFSPSALWAARRSGVAVVQTLHNFRPLCPAATFHRDGHICEDCLGRAPLPAVRHGCYRGSKAATAPLAAMISLHRLLRTWRSCVDCFIVPSEFARSKFVEAGWPPAKLAVKYNTVPDPGTPRSAVGDGFVCLSRLTPEKGVDVLLKAWADAFPVDGQRLTVLGSGQSEGLLRRQAAALPGVTFLGQLERPLAGAVLAEARALVVPSSCYELFPVTIAEAYALGVPVIASRIGSLAEVVEHERTGLLFPPRSATDLSHALRRLAADGDLRRRLARGARIAYDTRFSPARTTRGLLAIYSDVSPRTKAPPKEPRALHAQQEPIAR